jgi:hypothetical protein
MKHGALLRRLRAADRTASAEALARSASIGEPLWDGDPINESWAEASVLSSEIGCLILDIEKVNTTSSEDVAWLFGEDIRTSLPRVRQAWKRTFGSRAPF